MLLEGIVTSLYRAFLCPHLRNLSELCSCEGDGTIENDKCKEDIVAHVDGHNIRKWR
jgi:hypothetical protein